MGFLMVPKVKSSESPFELVKETLIGKGWTDHSNGNDVFLITASCSIAVKVLAYQSEGHGFKSRWSLGIFLSFFYNFQLFIIMNLVPQEGASLPIMWNIKMESYLYHLRQNTLISTEWYLKSFIYCHLLRKNRFRSSVYKLPVCWFFFWEEKGSFFATFCENSVHYLLFSSTQAVIPSCWKTSLKICCSCLSIGWRNTSVYENWYQTANSLN